MKKKVLVVGLGKMGQDDLKKLIELGMKPEDIVGVDIDDAKVTAAVDAFPPGILFSFDRNVVAHAAIVATNTPSHAKVVIDLMERGVKHILVEKPLAFTLEEATLIGEIMKRTNAQVFTAFIVHWSEAIPALVKRMENEELVLTESHTAWGKNRMGDSRPTPGDLEDEMVHGAGMVHLLAGVNQVIDEIKVSGMLTFPNFANREAQERAFALDPSFPKEVNASAYVHERIRTDVGLIPVALRSSFIAPVQVRKVGGVLAYRHNPLVPVYSFEFSFDEKRDGASVDVLTLTTLKGNTVSVTEHACDKLLEQMRGFLAAANEGIVDPRLTGYDDALKAVMFSEAVMASHNFDGAWHTALSRSKRST